MILCGTAITHSILLSSQRFFKTSSAATFEMPYGSTGLVSIFSLNGVSWEPYLAIEEQNIILLTLFDIAAEKIETEAKKLFLPIS